MTGILFGLAAAVLLGFSDLFAAKTSAFVPAITVARTAFAMSTIVAIGLVFAVPSAFILRDSLLALGSGALMAGSLVVLYHGYKVASIGLIAPTSAVLLGLIPVLDGIRKGDRPSTTAWFGMVLGIASIALATYQPGNPGKARNALILGSVSGAGFGCAFALLDYTSKESGLTPILVQRLIGGLLLAIALLFDRPSGRAEWKKTPWMAIHPPARLLGVLTGVTAGFAMAALQLGFRNGESGPVAVAASQFATVGVVLSVIYQKERLRTLQWVGVVGAAVGVALLASG